MSIGEDKSGDTGTLTKTGDSAIEQGGTPHDTAKAPDQDKADEQNYLLTFRDKEAAEVGFKDAQAKISQMGQELAEARGREEQAKMQAQINALNDAQLATQRGRDAESQKAQQEEARRNLEDLKRRVEEDGDTGALIDAFDSSIYSVQQKMEQMQKAHEVELKRIQSEMSGSVEQKLLRASPDYNRLKPEMDALKLDPTFKDMDETTLFQIAHKMKGDAVDNELGSAPPGSGGSGVQVNTPEEPTGLSEGQIAIMKKMQFTPEQIESAQKREKAKQRNGQ